MVGVYVAHLHTRDHGLPVDGAPALSTQAGAPMPLHIPRRKGRLGAVSTGSGYSLGGLAAGRAACCNGCTELRT